MTPLMLTFYFTCLCLEKTAQTSSLKFSTMHQDNRSVSADVGGEVILQCSNKDAIEFHWYKQSLGQEPKIISISYKYERSALFFGVFKDNPRFTLDCEKGRNHLKIADLEVSDSATYFCAFNNYPVLEFIEGITLNVESPGLNYQLFVNTSRSETLQPGVSADLSCNIHTGTSDRDYSIYWFKHSKESYPGLIYIHVNQSFQSQRKNNQQSCEYTLPIKSLDDSHVGTYYCAVVSCGHILFANRTKLNLEDQGYSPVLVYVLGVALAFTVLLIVILAVVLIVISKRNNCKCEESHARPPASSSNEQDDCNEENIHYAAVRAPRPNIPRRQMKTECVYSKIKQSY